MTSEQVVAIIVAATGLLGAIAIVIKQIGDLRQELNGRLAEMMDHAAAAARKEGELAGRDFERRMPQNDA